MALQLGGTVSRTGQGEYGRTSLSLVAGRRVVAAVPRLAGDVVGLDEPRRRHHRGAGRLRGHGDLGGRAGGGHARRGAAPVRAAVPPRGGAHRPGQRGVRPLPDRRLRVRPGVDARLHYRAAGGRGAGAGGRRSCAVRVVGRRRLGGRGGAGAQGGGLAAHLCVRRHRPDARRRGRPGRGHVPAPVQGRAGAREGGRPLLRRAWRV